MRRETIYCRARSTAVRHCPWAAVIARCEGGFIAFESAADYQTWREAEMMTTLERGQVPFEDLVELRTAHDIRKLRACFLCSHYGLSPSMLEIGPNHWHGRCFVEAQGLSALLRLPVEITQGLMIGDLGIDLMKRLIAHYSGERRP